MTTTYTRTALAFVDTTGRYLSALDVDHHLQWFTTEARDALTWTDDRTAYRWAAANNVFLPLVTVTL